MNHNMVFLNGSLMSEEDFSLIDTMIKFKFDLKSKSLIVVHQFSNEGILERVLTKRLFSNVSKDELILL